MDPPAPRDKPPKSRLRYRHRTQDVPSSKPLDLESKEEGALRESPDAPLLNRDQRGRIVMGKDHRQFHHRGVQAAATGVLAVEVVEVIVAVDAAGSLLSQETRTQTISSLATALSSGSAVPSVLVASPTVLAASSSVLNAVPSVLEASVTVAVPSALETYATVAVPSVLEDYPTVDVPSALEGYATVDVSSALEGYATVDVSSALESYATVDVPSALEGYAAVAVPSVLEAYPTVAVPSVSALPSFVFPSVPAVPSFPSDLTVPAYPYPSDVQVQAADVNTQSIASLSSSTAAVETNTALIPESNSETSSVTSSSSQSVFTDPQAIVSQSTSISWGAAPILSTSNTVTTSFATSSQATATPYYEGGGDDPANSASPPAAATTASPADTTAPVTAPDGNSPGPLETPKVVGSIVGSLAGVALILVVLLLLLKRHKRNLRSNNLVLPAGDGPTMAQAPVSRNVVPTAFLPRFSAMSRSTVDTSMTGEPSFQRVSGRKLPSAFSEGMTSGQYGCKGGSLSGASFYQDDQGSYGGLGLSKEFGPVASKEFGPVASKEFGPEDSNEFAKEIGDTPIAGTVSKMNIRPSPARTPIIHHASDENPFETNYRSSLNPPLSPNLEFPIRSTLGRSLASADGSRSSRFTENV